MKRQLLLILILFWSVGLFAGAADQNAEILLNEADRIRSKNPDLLYSLLHEVESLENLLSNRQRGFLLFLKGYQAGIRGNYAEALRLYEDALTFPIDVDLRVKTIVSQINILAINRNAVEGFELAQQLNLIIHDASEKVRNEAFTTLSIFYNQIDEYKLAEEIASRVILESSNPRSICYANLTLVEANYYLGKKLNVEKLAEAAKQCEEIEEYNPAGMITCYHARVLKDFGRTKEAILLLSAKEDVMSKTGYPLLKAWYFSELADVQLSERDYDNARINALNALNSTEQSTFSNPRIKALEILSTIAERENDFKESLVYKKLFISAKLASLDETKTRQLAIQQAKNDALEKANQIKLLDKENALLKTQAALDRTDIENSRLVIVTLVLLGTVIIIWLAVTRRMHRQLKVQAQTDKLTGIANRHYFTQLTESNLRYHARTKQTLAFAVFDLDLFKRINDTHGHIVGDWALKKVVQTVQNVCRGQDIIGRMGGEEFALLLPGCDIERAMLLIENCRSAIAAIDTSESGASFTITASFGVTDTDQCGYKFDQLYACADQALYRSKEEGRNMVYRYEPAEFDKQFVSQPV